MLKKSNFLKVLRNFSIKIFLLFLSTYLWSHISCPKLAKIIILIYIDFRFQLWQQSCVILHCWKNWSFGPSNTSFQNVWYAFCSSCYQTLSTRRPWPDLLSDITLVSQWCWWKATIQTNCPTVLSMSQFSSFQTRN